jgi:hypothetical protein
MSDTGRNADDLSEEKKEIVSHLSRESLVLFYGAFPSGSLSEIHWNKDLGGDWHAFLRAAKASGTTILYVDWVDFTKDYFDEALPQTGFEEEDIEERKLDRKRFAGYLGRTAAIRLGFFINATFHVYEEETTWHLDFGELIGQDDSSEEQSDEEEDTRELTEEWAEKLEHDSGFASLKRRSEKRSLLRKLAGSEFKKLRVDDVLWRAASVHEETLKAIREEKLAKQVKELKAKGMSNLAIAGKLGIPARQIPILLARFED